MSDTALIIVDVQNDFLPPSGSLAVPNGRAVLPVIEEMLGPEWEWGLVVASQDYHPPSHISFASSHPPHPPFSELELPKHDSRNATYTQTLWPDHCVQGTPGAEIEASLGEAFKKRGGVRLVRKGTDPRIEAYSAFEGEVLSESYPAPPDAEPPKRVPNGPSALTDFLRDSDIERTVIVGLATDYCVNQTAISSILSGFSTALLTPAMRGISPEGTAATLTALEGMGGAIIGRDGNGEGWQFQLHEWLK
ncbi:hypothetical protein L198_03223 [Cryptococcus wingfieldii CBS 7118]|uniref:nicotinamidase n=1 Tax=Cryptococcus wingfieldii CBS 7118 TaxID=1295528 RepID=A0A1E3JHI2_9TREE|nr:hypothetical protein L198_03223 [Cryptococcus wingfieldii CBS 7118]ODN99381.1 hypothetical protein L198_03223 [Cryptococcus wingfieldii CBS 7118]